MKYMGKILKIVLVSCLVVCEFWGGFMFVYLFFLNMKDTSDIAYGLFGVCLFAGFLAVSIAELVRIARGKKRVILPMLYMKIVVFLVADSVTMFYAYTYEKDEDDIYGGAATLIVALAVTAGAYAIRAWARKRRKSKNPAWTHEDSGVLISGAWFYDEVCQEYCRLHFIDIDDFYSRMIAADIVENSQAAPTDRDSQTALQTYPDDGRRIQIYACNYVAYLFIWLANREMLREDIRHGMLQKTAR